MIRRTRMTTSSVVHSVNNLNVYGVNMGSAWELGMTRVRREVISIKCYK